MGVEKNKRFFIRGQEVGTKTVGHGQTERHQAKEEAKEETLPTGRRGVPTEEIDYFTTWLSVPFGLQRMPTSWVGHTSMQHRSPLSPGVLLVDWGHFVHLPHSPPLSTSGYRRVFIISQERAWLRVFIISQERAWLGAHRKPSSVGLNPTQGILLRGGEGRGGGGGPAPPLPPVVLSF